MYTHGSNPIAAVAQTQAKAKKKETAAGAAQSNVKK
jgi:hypothetical protein